MLDEDVQKVIEIARRLVNKTSGWRKDFAPALPEAWLHWMEELERALEKVKT